MTTLLVILLSSLSFAGSDKLSEAEQKQLTSIMNTTFVGSTIEGCARAVRNMNLHPIDSGTRLRLKAKLNASHCKQSGDAASFNQSCADEVKQLLASSRIHNCVNIAADEPTNPKIEKINRPAPQAHIQAPPRR